MRKPLRMRELYQRIREIDLNEENRILTILTGPAAGGKALATGARIAWTSGPDLFPETLPEELPACGIVSAGGEEVFCELLSGEKKLVVCGGGHVSVPVVQIGKMLGFHVTVLEDREEFADRAARAGADRTILAPFGEGLSQIRSDEDTYYVIVTRAHRHDAECLRQILGMPRAYAGMMGSHRRTAIVKEMLAEEGLDRALLDSVRTPIGLEIGAETPEEIAVSIMAEIVEVKNRTGRNTGFPEPLLDAILAFFDGKAAGNAAGGSVGKAAGNAAAAQGPEKPGVLATIVRKHGAAPRHPGTRMLVRPDGTGVGTVGGGYAEALIIAAALDMGASEECFRMVHIDLSSDAAEEEGMVCGGTLDVMLERIEA